MPKRMTRKFATTVWLYLDTVIKLAWLKVVTRVPTAERVREGVDLVLEKYGMKHEI